MRKYDWCQNGSHALDVVDCSLVLHSLAEQLQATLINTPSRPDHEGLQGGSGQRASQLT
jgi:hypothetical protein